MDPLSHLNKLAGDKEKIGYGIYNITKAYIQITERLHGLQTNFSAELMAIYKTLGIITTNYSSDPHTYSPIASIFYTYSTHINKHPTQHHNHVDKTILTTIIDMLKTQTQPTTIYKVKTLNNIDGNEQAHQLAKKTAPKRNIDLLPNLMSLHILQHHTIIKKITWYGPRKQHDKGHVICLETYITKHGCEKNLRN